MNTDSFINRARTVINCACYGGATGNLATMFICDDLKYGIIAFIFYLLALLQDILTELRKLNGKNK